MIDIEKLDFSYEGAPLKTLEDINLKIEHGHCTAILGNNGAGKSTLLKCINRIHHATQGTVSLDGENIAQMNRRQMAQKIAYVPQNSEPTHTMVFDTILLGRRPYIKWDITSKDKEIVQGIIEAFSLEKYATRYMDELSGGERQKVILARAMAQEPKFLLLDEPTSSLDPKNQHEMLGMVKRIVDTQKIGAVIVIHDLNLALRYCDRFLFIKDTTVYANGGIGIITPQIIEDVYAMTVDIIEHKGMKIIIPLEK